MQFISGSISTTTTRQSKNVGVYRQYWAQGRGDIQPCNVTNLELPFSHLLCCLHIGHFEEEKLKVKISFMYMHVYVHTHVLSLLLCLFHSHTLTHSLTHSLTHLLLEYKYCMMAAPLVFNQDHAAIDCLTWSAALHSDFQEAEKPEVCSYP